MNHDVIVIGASTGGVDLLTQLVSELPADLPAAIFVAIHTHASSPRSLPELLSSKGRLPASHPLHGDKVIPGHIYVAPPDNHLYLRNGSMEIVRGPRENGHRPAVDALFRTASAAYGPRVVGIVLSGNQDCGTAGMMSIKARGGVAVVQDPSSARAPDMPRSVIERVQVDYIVHPKELPGLIARLVATPAAAASEPERYVHQLEGTAPGVPADLVCPTCQGLLTEAQSGSFTRFRCHVGHAFSLQSLVREQGDSLEQALWAAARALEESAALSRRLSSSHAGDLGERFRERAKTQMEQADLIRQIVLRGATLQRNDAGSA